MVELTITEIEEFGNFVLKDGRHNTRRFNLGFLGIKPKKGDILILDEKLVNKSSESFSHSYTFEKVEKIDFSKTDKSDVAELISGNEKILLQRMYG